MTQILDLPAVLDALGYTDAEHVQLAHMPPGGNFRAAVHPLAQPLPEPDPAADQWFGVNPVQPVAQGRPAAGDVTRLAAVWADLDVKAGGCPDFDTARAIIDDLSALLGTRPVAATMSGHGIQPLWAIEDAPIDDNGFILTRTEARSLLRRWGRLVAHVAERRGSQVDSVFDLPRILRRPGSMNLKNPDQPIPVVCLADDGAPVTLERLSEVLAECGIPELDEDVLDPGTVVSAPADWQWGPRTCAYAKTMIAGWAKDSPDARHPWLVAQSTRLAALHRAGCITQADHTDAAQALAGRFRQLLATGQARAEHPGEISGAIGWGIAQCAAMTEARMGRELGNARGMHGHDDQPFAATVMGNIQARQAAAPVAAPTDRPRLTVVPSVDGSLALQTARPEPTIRRDTDDGNAHALIDHYGDVIRYCADRGRWLTWTGYRWQVQPPGGGAVREMPKDVARRYVDDNPGNDKARKHGLKSLSAVAVTNALTMAASDPRITVETAHLDANPWVINTPGGLADLRTGTLRPALPEDLVTRTTNAIPEFGEPPAIWTDFLATTFGGDQDLIDYLQRLAGLALIGQVREQILPFMFGSGANGKSTLLEALMWAMRDGSDGYAKAVPAEILMVRKHEGHPTELADLAGARLVVCSELEDGQRLAEARVKLLTGRDTISARFLYGQPFTFSPSHLIVLAGNHRPQAAVGGPALWRRIRAVPFAHTVPEELRDPELPDKLQQVAGHILAWAIRGAADYVTGGMRQPEAVTAATKAYEQDQDTVGRFIEENIQLAPMGREPVKKIRLAYESWCMEMGVQSVSATRLTVELSSRFAVTSKKGAKGVRFYEGVVLLDTDDDTESNEQITTTDESWWQR